MGNDFRVMSVGLRAVAFVRNDGSVWQWGPFGTSGYELRRIPAMGAVKWASANEDGTLFGLVDGRVFGYGYNPWGLFGINDPPVERVEEVPSLRDVVEVRSGLNHALALRADGRVLSFGQNSHGQLGDETSGARLVPVVVDGVEDVKAIAACLNTSMALRRDGTVWIWGFAQHLLGQAADRGSTSTPLMVPGLDHVVEIGCADNAGFALLDDGQLYAWGGSANGLLATGANSELISLGVTKCRLPRLKRVFVGPSTVHAITEDGRRLAWGGGGGYTIGDGTSWPRFPPVSVYSE
jgi:alpha-tubulin suppressor-like RCC1 family protein